MTHRDELDPREGSIEMHTGCCLYWRTNAAGGRTYTSDEIPTGVEVWDTALIDMATLCEAMAVEFALSGVERRAEQRAQRQRAVIEPGTPVSVHIRHQYDLRAQSWPEVSCEVTPSGDGPSPLPEGFLVVDGPSMPPSLQSRAIVMGPMERDLARMREEQLTAELMNAQSDLQKLRAFAKDVFDDWPDGGGVDGFELQEIAEKHGLLVPVKVDKPCGEGCWCESYHGADEFPVVCYHKSRALTGKE